MEERGWGPGGGREMLKMGWLWRRDVGDVGWKARRQPAIKIAMEESCHNHLALHSPLDVTCLDPCVME